MKFGPGDLPDWDATYQVCEVYYRDGEPHSFTEAVASGDSTAEVIDVLEMMRSALAEDVLDGSVFLRAEATMEREPDAT